MDELRRHILRIDSLCTSMNGYQINSAPHPNYQEQLPRMAVKRTFNSRVIDPRAPNSFEFNTHSGYARSEQVSRDDIIRYHQLISRQFVDTSRNEAPKPAAQPVSVIVAGDASRNTKAEISSPISPVSSELPSPASDSPSPKSLSPSPIPKSPSPIPNTPSPTSNVPSPTLLNEESRIHFDFPASRNPFPPSSSSNETDMETASKKSRKMDVPDEQKDQKYWERRKRNNEAAKRSREARRLKEVEVSKRCDDLQQSNDQLRNRIDDLQKENDDIEKTLRLYANMLQNAQLVASKSQH